MGLDREFETGLDDRAGDRVMTAARAQRRDLALVIAVRVAERVLRQLGVVELRLDDVSHGLDNVRWLRSAEFAIFSRKIEGLFKVFRIFHDGGCKPPLRNRLTRPRRGRRL